LFKELKFSSEAYAKKAILDCIYWLSDKYSIKLDVEESNFVITCSNSDENFEVVFLRQLNDFNLRYTIANKTSEIKNLVIAKAFYPDLIEIESIGDFDDPVLKEQKGETK